MKYTEEELIEELQRVSKEHCDSEAPRTKDVKKYSDVSYGTYYNRFDSWDSIIEKAGFSKNSKLYSDDELIQEFWKVYEQKCGDKPPTTSDIREDSKFSEVVYISRFGSWDNVLRKFGFMPNRNLNKKDLLEIIKNISEKHCDGKPPKAKDIAKYSNHHSSIYYKSDYFENYNDALQQAGFDVNINFSCSEEDIIKDMKRVSEEYFDGGHYSSLEYKKVGKYSHKTPINKFGSWETALEECGIDTYTFKNFSKEYIKKEIKRVSTEYCNGEPPSQEDMTHGDVSWKTCSKVFGSWSKVLIECGFQANKMPSGENHWAWKGGENYYGPCWWKQRKAVLERDQKSCRVCNEIVNHDWLNNPDVHHIIPVRYWNVEEEHEKMNHLRNLISLCRSCHSKLEGKFKGRNHEEFEELAKDYLDIDEKEEKRSVFDY